MGALIRAHDWAATLLGPPAHWPTPLQIALGLILNTGHPMYIWWGPELLCFYNDAYRRSIGPERHPVSLGKPAQQVWEEIWDIIGPQINQVMSGGAPTWHENALVPITRNGRREEVYWTYSYSPILDGRATYGVGGVLVVCTETTVQVNATRLAIENSERFAQLFAQTPSFMALLRGAEHHFELTNPSYQSLIGHRDVLGRTVAEALPDAAAQGYIGLLDQVFTTGEPYAATGAKFAMQATPDGPIDERYVDFVFQPIKDPQGTVTGIFVDGVDVTSRTVSDTARRQSEELLRLATDAAEIGFWDLDVKSNTLSWPPRTRAMFGITTDRPVTLHEDFYLSLHPEDRDRVTQALSAALDPVQRAFYDVEYRTIGKEDGILRWVAAKGRGVYAQGRCVRVTGAALDITERKQSEAILAEADRRKDEFLATLAHELRNPLGPVLNAVRLLSANLDITQVAWCRDIIQRQTQQMALLLDDLLDISRVTLGRLQLKREAVAVAPLVDAAIETARPRIEARQHHLSVEIPDTPLLLDADPLRITQILSNLLTNAAKYTDQGGRISLKVRALPAAVEICVIDNGIGLDQHNLESVFVMFSQVDSALERSEGGLGIGLALVKGLVELHGGTIRAESAGLGGGSQFIVNLPRLVPSAVAPAAGPVSLRLVTPPCRIVIADDNRDAAETLGMLLSLDGHDVSIAGDGAQALEVIRTFHPHVAFIDIGMPVLNGYEVAQQLRAQLADEKLWLVALTGWGREENKRQAHAAGFDRHLTKPVDPDELQAVLQELIGS